MDQRLALTLTVAACIASSLALSNVRADRVIHRDRGTDAATRTAFNRPAAHLTSTQRMDFQLGRALFERPWVAAPASTDSADGLGPLYNARSCAGCHPRNGRGRALRGDRRADRALVLRLGISTATTAADTDLEPTYGAQLQPFSLAGQTAEGWLAVGYTATRLELADGSLATLHRPIYEPRDLGYGPLHPGAVSSPRLAPQLAGLGLLEAAPDADILALADPLDRNGDGISGRANRVHDPVSGRKTLGRFGWKAGEASLATQVESAFARDLGIATQSHPDGAGDCTPSQQRCRGAPTGNSPRHAGVEAGPEVTALVAAYLRGSSVPPRLDADDPAVRDGEATFVGIGCGACHRPDFPNPVGQTRAAYTDLLLHDMGDGLADGLTEGEAEGREWRTPPLWGLGRVTELNDQAAWLHDGRARTLLEAILWHGGEAQVSRDAVVNLSTSKRTNLLRFLRSL